MIFCVFNMCCCTVLQGIGRKELWIICWQWWWGLAQRKQWADWQCKDEIKKKKPSLLLFSHSYYPLIWKYCFWPLISICVLVYLQISLFFVPPSAFLFSYHPISACQFPCVSGGGGCAGREYELPCRQAVFCLEDCCQHGENGWGETGERWDWQLQPTFIHPSTPPPPPFPLLHAPSTPPLNSTTFLVKNRIQKPKPKVPRGKTDQTCQIPTTG